MHKDQYNRLATEAYNRGCDGEYLPRDFPRGLPNPRADRLVFSNWLAGARGGQKCGPEHHQPVTEAQWAARGAK